MQDRDILLRLLYRAFLDIRTAARESNPKVGERLSDLLHTLPLAILNCASDGDYSRALSDLKRRAEMFGVSPWLDTAVKDIAENEGSSPTS